MKKMRLEAGALPVASFPTLAGLAAPSGTVRANEATAAGQPSCGISCHTSCAGGGPCTCHFG